MRISLEQILANFLHTNQFKKKRHIRNLEINKNNKIQCFESHSLFKLIVVKLVSQYLTTIIKKSDRLSKH